MRSYDYIKTSMQCKYFQNTSPMSEKMFIYSKANHITRSKSATASIQAKEGKTRITSLQVAKVSILLVSSK